MTDANGPAGNKVKGRMILLLIGGVPLMVAAVSTWLWIYVVKGDIDLVGMLGTHNHGTLIQPPAQIDDFILATPEGARFKYADRSNPQWTFVTVIGDSCDEACKESLYIARQAHIALGKEARRIHRYAMGTNPQVLADMAETLYRDYKGVEPVLIEPALRDALSQYGEAGKAHGSIYVIDPHGWIMMVYGAHHTGRHILEDMKFLLKFNEE